MPNRIIKESIRTSKKINALSDFEFRFWTYLITYVDDFGRGSADPELINSMVFPRMKKLSDDKVSATLKALDQFGCIKIYHVDGEPFFYFPNWGKHQTIRNKKSKFPDPNDNDKTIEINCNQLQTNVPVIQSNTIQSNPNICSEPKIDSEPPKLAFLLNTGEEYPIYRKDVEEWNNLYPAVDVMQQLRNMKGWLDANPSKRKTKKGIRRFIVNWLSKEQDKGVRTLPSASSAKPVDPVSAMSAEEIKRILREG